MKELLWRIFAESSTAVVSRFDERNVQANIAEKNPLISEDFAEDSVSTDGMPDKNLGGGCI